MILWARRAVFRAHVSRCVLLTIEVNILKVEIHWGKALIATLTFEVFITYLSYCSSGYEINKKDKEIRSQMNSL